MEKKIIEESREIADEAGKEGITVAYEFHGGTLTDTNESAFNLLKKANHDNLKSYWQPPVDKDIEYRIEGLEMLIPHLSNVHAYYCEAMERRPFSKGKEEWKEYASIIRKAGGDRHIMLEFVKEHSTEQFLEDAEVLKGVVG